jgi:hypothetical protein
VTTRFKKFAYVLAAGAGVAVLASPAMAGDAES